MTDATAAEAAADLLAGASAVTFDLDDTLVEYRRSAGEVLSAAFDAADVDPLFAVEAYRARFAEFNDAEASMAALREACFAALAEERGRDPELGRDVARAYAAERDQSNVRWRPGAEELLDVLDARGTPYAVVTNGPPDAQAAKARAVGLDERAAGVTFAGHDAPAKPAPGAFDPALSALDAEAAEAVHVGDSVRTDATGAVAAGLRAVVVGEAGVDGADIERPAVEETDGETLPDGTVGVASLDGLASLVGGRD